LEATGKQISKTAQKALLKGSGGMQRASSTRMSEIKIKAGKGNKWQLK